MPKSTKVRCEQTGQIYASSAEAARAFKVNRPEFSKHINGKDSYTSFSGYTFVRVIDESQPFAIKPMHVSKRRPPIAIRCDQTGGVFRSIYRAAKDMELTPKSLWFHVKGHPRYPAVQGYTFTIVEK